MNVGFRRLLPSLIMPAALLGMTSTCWALGTGFTYQGQLVQSGLPVTDTCDLQFDLYDDVAAGTHIGTQTVTGVSVAKGVFSVTLNANGQLSAAAFTGDDRFLQIAVRCPAGSGTFDPLTTRQPLTPAPYAIYAATAGDITASYAASASKGGPASDLSCNGCVGATDVAANAVGSTQIQNGAITLAKLPAGSTNGQLLASNGSAAVWQNAPTSLPPSGVASGSLSGTYPSPSIAASAITSGNILDGTIAAADVNAAAVQLRVTGTCGAGAAINGVNQNGSVSCDASLQAQIDTLKSQVAALQTLLASVSIVDSGKTVRFTGVNVQVVSGGGSTAATINGKGNLIVGYNAGTAGQLRTGSHNLIVGDEHEFVSYGGLVAGTHNTVNGPGASVTAGFNNIAGQGAAVSGGVNNKATGLYASVSGGESGTASGDEGSVSGGTGGTASGKDSSVTGGQLNTANGTRATVCGGTTNTASSIDTVVSGGGGNTANGFQTTVGGGVGVNITDNYVWHAQQAATYPKNSLY